MYKKRTVFIIIPVYNEETQIPRVLSSIPALADRILVVNDGSTDNTVDVVAKLQKIDARVELINNPKNVGVGAARAAGFKQALEENADLLVAIDGDAQMDSSDIQHLLDPLVEGVSDFAKANRLASGEAWRIMPRLRFFANAIVTLLTKVASGYWHVTDSQSGFFAMTAEIARRLDFENIFPRYGCENSMLIHLSVLNARVKDVPSKPIYGVGEISHIRLWRDVYPVLRLLRRGFFWRIFQKYVVRDFHPLVFFYFTGLSVSCFSTFYLLVIIVGRIMVGRLDVSESVRSLWLNTLASPLVTVVDLVFFILGLQMLFFAMWMDMEENRRNR